MSKLSELEKVLSHRVLVLDGAMGTMIQRRKFTEEDYRGLRFANSHILQKGNNDLLSITQPYAIREIHSAYLQAGANIITTNTFNANAISMADYDMQKLVVEMNATSVRLARESIDLYKQIYPDTIAYVAGSMGPTNKSASISPDVINPGFRNISFDDLVVSYQEQASALIGAGVDILLLETVFDALNCKAALYAIQSELARRGLSDFPIMVSGTITDKSGRILSGQTIEAFLNAVSHVNLLSIGLNCSFGADLLRPYVEELSKKAPFYVSAHPNAGLPNQLGAYDETPDTMRVKISHYLDNQLVNIIGGCCGTTPEHIREIALLAQKAKPRSIPKRKKILRLSGMEALNVDPSLNFVNIGERTNVAGSRKFARLIREEKFDEAISIAREMVEGGAQVIDINMDDSMLDAKASMIKFLNLLASEPDIARLPFMIDSSKWDVIEAGLKCVQGKSIVNSISLKEGEDIFVSHALKVKKMGAAVVVMAFDEKGQADSLERRIEICERSYNILTNKIGFPAEDIIFDPNVLSIATGIEEHNNFAVDFIETVRYIKEHLPYAKVSGGVSNLSFSFRGNDAVREVMHSVFLYHAIAAGMDMGIVNPGMLQIYDDIPKDLLEPVEDVVLNRRQDATERLIAIADKIKNGAQHKELHENVWRTNPVSERLSHALIKGVTDFIEEDIKEAIPIYKHAIDIIEGPLMDGIKSVGIMFGQGKMFLPQVVKSARVMKKAVSVLQPYIEKEQSGSSAKKAGKVLIATVKGDVHDIGKNIVSVVMGCNNYEVEDLGVMVPCEDIIEAIKRYQPDFVCLSGLITPSLEEMVHVAQEMEKNNIRIPLLVGGATTSKVHTAVKIAPCYSGLVIHCMDASKNVTIMSRLLSSEREEVEDEYRRENEEIRNSYYLKEQKILSLADARANKLEINWDKATISVPKKLGKTLFLDYHLQEIRHYINWTSFFHAWNLNGSYPSIFNHPQKGEEARKLMDDANVMLNNIISSKILRANAVVGIYPACSVGDDIEVYETESSKQPIAVLHQLRNQLDTGVCMCLADYIAPKGEKNDYIGFFALTTSLGLEEEKSRLKAEGDDYNSLMLQILADRLAEAFSELLHLMVRKEIWGYTPDENLSIKELLRGYYRGIRPAIGYPSCPDHSEKEILFRILDAQKSIGVSLTDSFMMQPQASICGMYFALPEANYFLISKIKDDQVIDYAERKGMSVDAIRPFINSLMEEHAPNCPCCKHNK